jgi:hypothetical protein
MGQDQAGSDAFAPVEGVSLEVYTRAAVELHGLSPDEMNTAAEAHGIPKGRLQAVAEGWNKRMTEHPEVVQRYSALYQQAMRDAGIKAPEITLEQYAEILREAGTRPLEEVLPAFGLNVQTFALVSGQWIERMRTDTTIAAQLAALLAPGAQA